MSILRLIPVAALISAFCLPLGASAQTTAAPPPAGAANSNSAGSGAAGSPSAHHGHHHRRPSFMHALHGVNLSADQKQKIAGFRAQLKGANANADPATKKANVEKMHAQVMGVLRSDQRTQLNSAMHPAPAQQGAPSSQQAPAAPPAPAASPELR